MVAKVMKWLAIVGFMVAGVYLFIFSLLLLDGYFLHLKVLGRLEHALEMWLTKPGMTYRWEAGALAIWTLAVYAGLLLCVSLLVRAIGKALERRAARRAKASAVA